MAKNQKSITKASYNYLFQFSAIPVEKREEYLSVLLKRKNADKQKNVVLLKKIYEYVNSNKIYEWNPEEISKTLKVTLDTLYQSKSRLLRGIRKFYFGWEYGKIESELNSSYGPLEDEMKKALAMNEIGLKKEGRIIMLSIEKRMRVSAKKTKDELIFLAQLFERLIVSYSTIINRRKIEYYFNKLKNLCNYINRFKLTEEENLFLQIRLNYATLTRQHMKFHKNHHESGINYLIKQLEEDSKKINSYQYLLKIIISNAMTADLLKDPGKAAKCCKEGIELSSKLNLKDAKYSFMAFSNLLKSRNNKKTSVTAAKEIIKYYYNLKKTKPAGVWTFYLENFCAELSTLHNLEYTNEIYRNRINTNILFGDYSYSIYLRFRLDSENFYSGVFSSFKKEENWIYPANIDKSLLSSSENIYLNTIHYSNAINNLGFVWELQLYLLIVYFFNEDDFDYEKTYLLIKKMEHLIRNKRKASDFKTFNLLKLSAKMIYHKNERRFIYTSELKNLIDEFKVNHFEISVLDYAIISSLAHRLGIPDVTVLVKDLFQFLLKKQRNTYEPLLRKTA